MTVHLLAFTLLFGSAQFSYGGKKQDANIALIDSLEKKRQERNTISKVLQTLEREKLNPTYVLDLELQKTTEKQKQLLSEQIRELDQKIEKMIRKLRKTP